MTIQWYVCSFVDVFGQTGSLVVPTAAFDDAAANGIPFDGSALEGRARVLESDMRLRPDPATVVELDDGHAQAWCAVVDGSGAPWPVDPRTALMLTVERLPELAGEMRLGAELEFYLLDGAGVPVDRARYYSDLDGPGSEVVLRVPPRSPIAGSRSRPRTPRPVRVNTSSISACSRRLPSPTRSFAPRTCCDARPAGRVSRSRSWPVRCPTSRVPGCTSCSRRRCCSAPTAS